LLVDSAVRVVLICDIDIPASIFDGRHPIRSVVAVFRDPSDCVDHFPEPSACVVRITDRAANVVLCLSDVEVRVIRELYPAAIRRNHFCDPVTGEVSGGAWIAKNGKLIPVPIDYCAEWCDISSIAWEPEYCPVLHPQVPSEASTVGNRSEGRLVEVGWA